MKTLITAWVVLAGATAWAETPNLQAQADLERAAVIDRSAAAVARDGQFLPLTLSARIGDQRVSGLFLGGYDTAAGQGPSVTANVEGAIFHRVAIHVGIAYRGAEQDVSPSVGVRVAILRQERHHINLALGGEYKNLGFSEGNGEFEFAAMLSRRWARTTLFANLVYGQGLNPAERDGEVRAAVLYAVHPLVNVGLDTRTRFDLGEQDADREANQVTTTVDFTAGPVATVSWGPLSLVGQVGLHTLLIKDQVLNGLVALGGLGAAF